MKTPSAGMIALVVFGIPILILLVWRFAEVNIFETSEANQTPSTAERLDGATRAMKALAEDSLQKQERIDSLEQEVKQLREELSQAKAENAGLERAFEALADSTVQLRNEVIDLKSVIEGLKRDVWDAKNEGGVYEWLYDEYSRQYYEAIAQVFYLGGEVMHLEVFVVPPLEKNIRLFEIQGTPEYEEVCQKAREDVAEGRWPELTFSACEPR